MAAGRHIYEHRNTREAMAEISVVTRHHAMRNPQAVKAMEDLGFLDIRETSIEDVLNSRMIADPSAFARLLHDLRWRRSGNYCCL